LRLRDATRHHARMAAPRRTAAPHAGDETNVDGRRAWRDRNLNAVVDALLDLFAEGNLRPGADEIAARSGVSRRSVFRYFDDLDSLDRVATERQLARVSHLIELEGVGEGALGDRIARIVAQRLRLYEAIAPVARRRFRRQAEAHFERELRSMSRAARAEALGVIDSLLSFETYELQRIAHGHSAKQTAGIMRRGIAALLGG
jgi:AcrR family transcriptional regulator